MSPRTLDDDHLSRLDLEQGTQADLLSYLKHLSQQVQQALRGMQSQHADHHQAGGDDEISVAGLSGLLATPQTPIDHHADHENGGTQEINVTGLSGVLADKQDADHLQGRDVASTAPSDGQVLAWDAGASAWTPTDVVGETTAFDTQTAEVSTLDAANWEDTGLAATITVPAGGASVLALCSTWYKVNNGTGQWRLEDTTNTVTLDTWTSTSTSYVHRNIVGCSIAPSAGDVTVKLQYKAGSGSGYRAYIELSALQVRLVGP